MRREHDIITIEVELRHETEEAYLVGSAETGEGAWIPKSQVELDGNEMQMPEWLAVEKHLI